MPWKMSITAGFGEKDAVHLSPHQGIDFAMPTGTPIRCFNSGTVIKVGHGDGFGNSVWVKFNDGYTAVFGHLDKVSVKVGERVFNTEVIGFSGDTGHSTGPHLHLGVLNPNGHWMDPSRYVNLEQALNPKVLYGAGDWADNVARGWFQDIGRAVGNGIVEILHNALIELDHIMPEVAFTALIVGSFLKMFGAKKWSARFLIGSGVGTAWIILS